MDLVNQLVEQFKAVFSNMNKSQKISFILVLVSIAFCMVAVFMWSSKPDYAVLFADLSTDDAAKIHSKLTELNVPYEIQGTTIMVPSKHVYETRLQLANEGLPKGSTVGFEIFDKASLGQTDYLQRLNFQRALEGELSRTISSLESVEFARVHLVIPKPTIFSEKQEKVSSSIIITPNAGRALAKSNVVAITHLVSSSVEGLSPNDVTVIDSTGNLLSDASETSMSVGMTTTQLEAQKRIERYMTEKVLSLLIGFLGPNKAIVRVNAEVDFSQMEETKEKYNPESQVARSENRVEETSSSKRDESGAAVEKTITNYEIDKTVQHIIGATGKVSRLSIAVVVDGTYKAVGEGKSKELEYVARTQEEKDAIQKLVMSSIGIDAERGDTIEVINIPFDNSYVEEERAAMDSMRRNELIRDLSEKAMPWVIVLAIVLALFFMLRKVISQAMLARPESAMAGAGAGGGFGGGGFDREGMEQNIFESMKSEELQKIEKRKAETEMQKMLREHIEGEILEMAEESPDAVAKIIKDWLLED